MGCLAASHNRCSQTFRIYCVLDVVDGYILVYIENVFIQTIMPHINRWYSDGWGCAYGTASYMSSIVIYCVYIRNIWCAFFFLLQDTFSQICTRLIEANCFRLECLQQWCFCFLSFFFYKYVDFNDLEAKIIIKKYIERLKGKPLRRTLISHTYYG